MGLGPPQMKNSEKKKGRLTVLFESCILHTCLQNWNYKQEQPRARRLQQAVFF